MKIDIMTLFPDTVNAFLHESILGRAAKKGILDINCIQIRDYTDNRQNQVDDYPYGGGFGCVLMAQPLKAALDAVRKEGEPRVRVLCMSPQGQPFTQETAKRLQRDYDHLILICGHYEGIDERFVEACVDEEVSLGDFVLTGGEIAAMAVADAVCRLVPGVLSDPQCYMGESHWDGLLEYPQYTRPEVWEGRSVPEPLLNGDHEKVARWRRLQQLERTRDRRPDLFQRFEPQSDLDREMLAQLRRQEGRTRLTEPLGCRPATVEDLPAIFAMRDYARESLRRHHVDQWQGEYPSDKLLVSDIADGEGYVIVHGEDVAAYFVLTMREEPDYELIRDGKWTPDLLSCNIHRAMVGERYRGTGVSSAMFAFAEDLTRAMGRRCVRLDTHKDNKAMLKLMRDCGYRYRGNVSISAEPGHETLRRCFEKVLREKKQ
ncbi:MAG: tRNA (guanosine(37)-N1)-methyltransferase TrmD [Oscillospiraceae bacterium]|nr:tRNA (guanosine(37)-N1)-methyltransferase TrmD [Oscillospiraceae bacterium]